MKIYTNISLLVFLVSLTLSGCYSGYKITDGKVYNKWIHGSDWSRDLTLLEGADASSFKTIKHALNLDLGKDKNRVYIGSSVLMHANPVEFRHIEQYYWKDNKYVFLLQFGGPDYIIKDADPASFNVIRRYSWAKDKNYIYYAFSKLLNVNPNDFIAINQEWGRDNNFYYWHNHRLDSLDYKTAVIVSDYYIKDKSNVYYKNKLIKDVNSTAFKADGIGSFGHDDKFMFDSDKNMGLITDQYRKTYIDKKHK